MPPHWDAAHVPALDGKIVVITGANSGIGYAAAIELASKQAHVVLACRSRERGERASQEIRDKTGSERVEFMALDVGSLASVRTFVDAFNARFDRLDVLVNNAGIMNADQAETVDGFETHFGVNHLGHFYLTSLLFGKLKKAKAARVVNVSSTNHRYATADYATIGYKDTKAKTPYLGEYSDSKLANLLFTYELDRRLRAAGILHVKSVACHPGITLTNIIPQATKSRRMPDWLQSVIQKVNEVNPIFRSPEVGALPTLYAATVPTIQSGDFIGPDGWGSFWGWPAKDESSPASHSEQDAIALWRRSEELLKISFVVQ